MLISLSRGGMEERNLEFAAALARAVNDWQKEEWVRKEPRLRAGIVITAEDPTAAVAEIERRADDSAFVQVILSPRNEEPLGRRRYWPIYEAAARYNIPIGLHPAGYSGGHPTTAMGWPTYYMQEHYAFETAMQSMLASLVIEGVFERFPTLKVAHRVGLHLGAGALLAHGQALASACAPRSRISSGRRPNTCASTSGSPRNRSRSRSSRSISPR